LLDNNKMPEQAAAERQAVMYGHIERLAFVAGFLIMLGIVGASVWLARQNEANLGDAAHTQIVRAKTVDLLEAVTTAETGQRGYLLTGSEAYLAPYTAATVRVPDLLHRLQLEIGGGEDFNTWRTTINAKMAELAETVDLTRAGHRDQAMAIVQSNNGQNLMDQARAVAQRLTETQRAALVADLHRSQVNARNLVAVDVMAFVLLVMLTLLVSRSGRRYVAGLAAARASLQTANAALQSGRDRLEQAVAERTSDLTRANEEIQRFAYIISHDLRAPLLNIIGFTSELENATSRLNRFVTDHIRASDVAIPEDVRTASEEDLPEAIRFIQTSTAKMDRLINAILRLSREGRRVLVPERLEMEVLLNNVIDSVRHQVAAADAEMTVQAATTIVSDRIAMEQIFSNLIENALKYLMDGRPGRIAVSSQAEPGHMVRFDVADNGRGIAARDMERVFELFRRAGNQDRPGEGIGLAHVKALVRRLGGSIECRSTLGEGSVFSVRLPVALAHSGADLPS
jgi:signal transduction histidine kinase